MNKHTTRSYVPQWIIKAARQCCDVDGINWRKVREDNKKLCAAANKVDGK